MKNSRRRTKKNFLNKFQSFQSVEIKKNSFDERKTSKLRNFSEKHKKRINNNLNFKIASK